MSSASHCRSSSRGLETLWGGGAMGAMGHPARLPYSQTSISTKNYFTNQIGNTIQTKKCYTDQRKHKSINKKDASFYKFFILFLYFFFNGEKDLLLMRKTCLPFRVVPNICIWSSQFFYLKLQTCVLLQLKCFQIGIYFK